MSDWNKNLERYDKIVAKSHRFERKGKTVPYTSANGYMFSLLNKDAELGIRLPKERVKEVIEEYGGGPFYSHGATMRDYVLITEKLLKKEAEVLKLLEESFDFVNTLKPK